MRLLALAWLSALPGLAGCADDPADRDPYVGRRWDMVSDQIQARGVQDARVLAAMRRVLRHEFVPPHERVAAYADNPVAIGEDQTISQPYVVALMTEQLGLPPRHDQTTRVLEVGTGSGYQAAVLAEIATEVYSIEIIPSLCRTSAERLSRLGVRNVQVRCGDGYWGWPAKAPFDAVLVTAAAPQVPEPLRQQVRPGGRIVIPVGDPERARITVLTRTADGFDQRSVLVVGFVPMTGEAQRRRPPIAPR